MSNISRLTTLGASGSGGEKGWIVEIDPVMSGDSNFNDFVIDGNDNVYLGGSAGSDLYCYAAKATLEGDFTTARLFTESPPSGISYYIRNMHLFSSGTGILAGATMYSTNGGERAGLVQINSSTLEFKDLNTYYQGQGQILGWRNSNSRSGRAMTADPDSDEIYMATNGWNGSRVGNYILNNSGSYGSSPSYWAEWGIYSTQYTRSMIRDGTTLYCHTTTGPDTGSGGWGNMVAKFRTTDAAGQGKAHSYSSSGGAYGPQQTQAGESPVSMAQDSTYLYTAGKHHTNYSSDRDRVHVRKIRKSDLNLMWERMVQETSGGNAQYLQGKGAAVDDNGNVYISTENDGINSHRPKIIKYNSSGTLQWMIEFGRNHSSDETQIHTMKVHNGFLYFCGRRAIGSNRDAFFVKFPLDGVTGTFGNFIISQVSSSNILETTSYPSYAVSALSENLETPQVSARDISQANNAFSSETLTSL